MVRPRYLPALLLLLLVSGAACSRRAARIEVSPKKVKIYGLDKTQRMTGRLLDKKERPLEIGTANWESANPAVATVDPGGLVTPKSEGTTKIIAKYDKIRTEIPLEVIDVKSLEIVPTSVRLIGPAGVQIALQATVKNSKDKPITLPLVWTSSNPEFATIAADGTVTSVGKGTTTIIARLGDVQGAAEVVVDIRNLQRIEIRPITALVRVGDSQKFQVIAYDADGKMIEGAAAKFVISDPAVATVSAGGGASGVKPGAAIVRASIGTLTTEATLIVN